MAKDPFEEKLAAMIEKRRLKNEKEFEKGIKSIADIVGYSILNEEYDIDEDFLDTLEECAKTCDAADNLCRYVFQNENCKRLGENVSITTIKCIWNYDYNKFREEIDGIFENENLDAKKGFVYIFWSAAPLEYSYVGKTDIGTGRLKEKTHTNVVRSIETAQSTKLTIIYPNAKINIDKVEASVIRMIGIENLEYNEQEPSIEGNSNLSQRLSELKDFFGQLYSICDVP
ncbi:hypothetical protein R83H12_01833 [Fibrobacteria bacterium R8-3-H12]